MNLRNSFINIITKFSQQGISDRANFLKNAAVVAWALSSLAQTCAIFFNEKMPAKEKRFLIPQEIFDGLINATLFWFITSKAASFGKKLVLQKCILPKSLTGVMEDFIPKSGNIDKLKESFLNHIKNYGKPGDLKVAKDAVEGMSVLVGIIGAVISNNIITPILRNKLAGMWQKRELQKESDNAPLNPYFGINSSKYDFTKPVINKKITPFCGTYSGNLKI